MRFHDRDDAGQLLGRALRSWSRGELNRDNALILALPRGGIPVGLEVARALDLPLDTLIVRKLGVPWHPELGLGAIAEGDVCEIDRQLAASLDVDERALARVIAEEQRELVRRVASYRGARPPLPVAGRTVLLVDDGIATGGTMRAAIVAMRARAAHRIVVAVPVAAAQTVAQLQPLADDVVTLLSPEDLVAVGLYYERFEQLDDEAVTRGLEAAATQ